MNRMIVTLPIDWIATGNDNLQGAEGMRRDHERAAALHCEEIRLSSQ
jgi:hypothetical protein